jgi:protoporphyrinogen IX oxidase
MFPQLLPWYKLVLSLHIISVISWMAGLLYLFRLFVYHAAEKEDVVKTRFQVMEWKLYRIITMPAMVAAFVFGATMLVLNPSLLQESWMHLKLLFATGLIGVTHYSKRVLQQFAKGTNQKSERYFRIMNEVPTLLMIGIVILVIMRPF